MKFIVSLIVLMFILSCPCASTYDMDAIVSRDELDAIVESIPKEIYDLFEEYDITSGQGFDSVLHKIKEKFIAEIYSQIDAVRSPAIAVILFSMIGSLLCSQFFSDKRSLPIMLCCGGGILMVTLSDTNAFYGQALQAVRSMYDFSTVLMPCIAGISVIAGATVSAGVKYTAAALFMNLLLNFCNSYLLPMVSVYLASIIGETFSEQKILGTVASGIRWVCKTLITSSVVVFVGYLNVAGLVTATGDQLSTRITQAALSTALPVVGSILSNTANLLVSGASVLRNSIGVLGMLVILSILLFPFLTLGIRYLLFKAIAEIIDLFPGQKLSKLIHGIAGAFGMTLGILGTGFIVLFLTLISFMQLRG